MADNGATSDFQLPDEILSVIPTDPYEQLNLARKITSLAIASRVSKLESEAGRMRQKIADKDSVISELQSRISELEIIFRETDARLRTSLEENIKLLKERDSLLVASKKMSRDLAKMETFKRHLMQSLNDDNTSTETVDIGTCDQSITKASTCKDGVSAALTAPYPASASTEKNNTTQDGKKFISSYITPRLTPGTTPKVKSNAGSPKRCSTGVSPKMTSGATSPSKSQAEGYTSMSPWCPSSKQSSAANSPPRGRSLPGRTRVDGKEFFRQAKNRLSYEQFAAFLANIKELNAQRQSREETSKKAEEIFGADNKDLFLSFQGLLNRNMP
ncbi:uncharacterized protein At4g15545 [Dendrobium catenatum]|uniref:At4g15545-like C-terminal domain-containing protein n=1 Tax=Dendrobium catenatum TaxID=906689 RepID=A0A2I0VR04_9ASPA|nr:uncharacterized protein At4g15545 [Dendrobium catenatum]PKU65845.1 Uncharacterized protein MA16_Dca009174 [Dendrobium catenatum]